MRISRRLCALVAGAGLAGSTLLAATPASAHTSGDRSLAALLTADGNTFDRNSRDYDVVTEAVLAVLAAKPSSPVAVLADGSTPLTAFLPNDGAFRLLVKDLTGRWVRSERGVFQAVAGLGIDTVETVLLYHVVPGATITKAQARRADGATLTTAQGGTIRVKVPFRSVPLVILKDADPNDANPFVVRFDLNRGNRQIAHGISLVLRPADL
jgi:fasciclin domain-containing protein